MSRELQLLAADCRQALFDAVKTDEGAGNSLRFEVGRAVGLLGRLSDALTTAADAAASDLLATLKRARGQIVAALISEYGPDVAVQSVAHIDAAIARATPTAEGVA